MDRYEQLLARYPEKWSKDPSKGALTNALHTARGLSVRMVKQGEELRKPGTLTPKGLNEQLRSFASKQVIPDLRRAAFSTDQVRASLDARRAALSVPLPDKSDFSAAVLRMDIRGWLKQLRSAELMAVLADDGVSDLVLQAAFEVPPGMIGVTPKMIADIRRKVERDRHGDALDEILEGQEAVKIVDIMIQLAVGDVRRETGFDVESNKAFDEWMASVSAPIDREMVSEAERRKIMAAADNGGSKERTQRKFDALVLNKYEVVGGALVYHDPELNAA
ncbi:hypothetical protein [Sinorhizobium americanum]|uniref:Uncharacterized protein n=1 Tax=Sinorhizobium americanum TaxID=194963 RepID=A0A4R2BR62_9HYPH|nr:hypothetical protein [Sinorhizobium americanum]TCN30138.1 hypothetical protein EV184_1084 [Sinorhizobium americanum]